MLALTIDAILDFAGDRSGSFRMIGCEVQSHDAYGTPGSEVATIVGHASMVTRRRDGYRCAPPILYGLKQHMVIGAAAPT